MGIIYVNATYRFLGKDPNIIFLIKDPTYLSRQNIGLCMIKIQFISFV